MKSASIRDFRSRLADLLDGDEPLLVNRHGRSVAIVYPLRHPANLPMDVRRSIVDLVARRLALHPDWRLHSPVIELYKRDVDRTLIAENLRRTAEERLRNLQAMQRFSAELRGAGRR